MNLNHHTLHTYDEQLQHLTRLILSLGDEVGKMVAASRESFRQPDEARVAEAKAADKHINALDGQIEEEATIVLALQNPMAVDLRFVTGVLKITGMLERAGELAKNTVKRSVKIGRPLPPSVLDNLEHMTRVIEEMLRDVLEAFAAKDTERALAVWRRDDEIDNLYRQIFKAMQKDMSSSPENVASGTHVVFAAKNLERIADYTTNIAKTVYYVTSGKRADKGLLDSRPDA